MRKPFFMTAGLLFLLLAGCAEVNKPTGYIGAKDKEAPELVVIYPKPYDTVTGFLNARIQFSDFSGIRSTEFSTDMQQLTTCLYTLDAACTDTEGTTHDYTMEVSWLSGLRTLSISVTDYAGNTATRSVPVYFRQILKQVIRNSMTNQLSIVDMESDTAGAVYFGTGWGVCKYAGGQLDWTGAEICTDFAISNDGIIWGDYRYPYLSPPSDTFRGVREDGSIVVNTAKGYTHSFACNSKNEVWGLYGSGYFRYAHGVFDTTYMPEAKWLVIDRNDILWLATDSLISCYNGVSWSSANYHGGFIVRLWLDCRKNVLVQTVDGIYKHVNGSWPLFRSFPPSISPGRCDVDTAGYVWIKDGKVLKCLNGSILARYDVDQGGSLAGVDRNNNIWLTGEFCLYMINEAGL